MSIAYSQTATTLSVFVDFRSHVIPKSHPNFAQLVQLVSNPKTTEADIKPLLDIPTAITNFTGGDVAVHNGRLFYRGVEVKNNLATIILGFVKSGDANAAEPFKKFLANCRQNPDLALVETIYDWCVKGNLPITPDGELIAWKIVGKDYMSLTAGKRGHLRHRVGDVVTEPREECDPNRNRTCSRGIHFCSIEYLQNGGYGGGLTGGNRVMAVVINPADITAIPTDYNLTKGRCCKLRVVGEVEGLRAPDYYGSAKVYSGWEAPKTPKTRFPVRAGDVWRNRQGDLITVTRVISNVAYNETDQGGNWADSGLGGQKDGPRAHFDFVELVSEGKPVRKTPTFTKALRKGDVVRLRNGTEATVTDAVSGIATIKRGLTYVTSVFTNNGRGYRDDIESTDRATDVIDVIRSGPVTPRNAAGFAVGQTWKRRNGTEVTLTSIDGPNGYPVRAGSDVFTATGRFNSDTSVSQLDLVRLVKDVD